MFARKEIIASICICMIQIRYQYASFSKRMVTVISRTHSVSIGIRRSRMEEVARNKSSAPIMSGAFAKLVVTTVSFGMGPKLSISKCASIIC